MRIVFTLRQKNLKLNMPITLGQHVNFTRYLSNIRFWQQALFIQSIASNNYLHCLNHSPLPYLFQF